ncbi:hypothetical protein BG000_003735 [Podila horticola]|nr:hypothetical protein BG000_003735 [Podila horticola]
MTGSGRIKLLKLHVYKDRQSTIPFWSWLWRFCGERLEALELIGIGPGITANLTSHVHDYLPNLEDLEVGDPDYDEDDNDEQNWSFGAPQVDDLIMEAHALQVFQISPKASAVNRLGNALLRHRDTLQVIYIDHRVSTPKITRMHLSGWSPME